MKTSTLIAAFIAIAFCSYPTRVYAQKKAAGDEEKATAEEYIDITKAMFDNMNSAGDSLGEMKNGATSALTTKKLNRLTAELNVLRAEFGELGAPTPEVTKQLEGVKDLEALGKKAGDRFKAAMSALPENAAEIAEPLENYANALRGLGAAMQNIDEAEKKAGGADGGAADEYIEVLSSMLDVQFRVGDILATVKDKETAEAAVRKIKRCTSEVTVLVEEFKALPEPTDAANAAMEKNKVIPKRTEEVVEHITKAVETLSKNLALSKIVEPALTEFSEACESIGEEEE